MRCVLVSLAASALVFGSVAVAFVPRQSTMPSVSVSRCHRRRQRTIHIILSSSPQEEGDSEDANDDTKSADDVGFWASFKEAANKKLGAPIPITDYEAKAAQQAENDFLKAMQEAKNSFAQAKNEAGGNLDEAMGKVMGEIQEEEQFLENLEKFTKDDDGGIEEQHSEDFFQ